MESSAANGTTRKITLTTKKQSVYSTLRQTSPTIASKLLILEAAHSHGVLCSRRFPGRGTSLKSAPPSKAPMANHHGGQQQQEACTTKAISGTTTAAAAAAVLTNEQPTHNHSDSLIRAESLSSISYVGSDGSDPDLQNVLTPRNLENEFKAMIIVSSDDVSFDSEGAKAEEGSMLLMVRNGTNFIETKHAKS